MVGRTGGLDSSHRAAFERDGCVILREFASATDAVGDPLGRGRAGASRGDRIRQRGERPFVLPEANLRDVEVTERRGGRLQGLPCTSRGPVPVVRDACDLVAAVGGLIGTDAVRCFLSQFIFKNPGAWGQPCHQDSFYFPFTPMRPVVGVWLA